MAGAVERTFCFIDLAGFTALTEAHGDDEAVALLDRFMRLTRAALPREVELVKSIGDAVMLAGATPGVTVRAVASIVEGCQAEDGFPLPRAGAHHGPAISRDGDYLGGAVNLAARVAGHAAGSQFVVTGVVAEAARKLSMEVVGLGTHRLRNVHDPVELFEVRLGVSEPAHMVDPVCRMRVDRESAAGSLRYAERELWFCSLACVATFAADPGRYHDEASGSAVAPSSTSPSSTS